MNNDEDVTFFGYHVVCLIDVLGQRNKLAEWSRLPDGGQITQEFIQALKKTVGTVLSFRDQFMIFFNQLGQFEMPPNIAALPEEQQKRYYRFKACDVQVQRFSDTFLFSSLIPNAHGDASVMPLFHVIGACSMAMLLSLAAGTPVRGALCIGSGAMLEDGSFYGPALSEAHHLESEVAGYPRVVVSPTGRSFLAMGQKYSSDRQADAFMKQMASMCRSLIHEDTTDGNFMIDFLGEGVRNLFDRSGRLVDVVGAAYRFVRSEAVQFREVGESKLANRYESLLRYVESRLPIWGISIDD